MNFATHWCRYNDNPLVKKEGVPQVNVYVRLQNTCNANCKFCEFCGKAKKFDEEKFKSLLIKLLLNNQLKINKLSFTGGEPTLDFDLFKRMLDFVNTHGKDIFTVVNTNGLHLKELATLDINSVALSRHHYDDDVNTSIFQTKVPSAEDISSYIKTHTEMYGEDNLHVSCNLQRDYIGSSEEVKKYLEWCSNTGISDVGFVGLMNVNEYCKEQFVDYDVLRIPDKKIIQTKRFSKDDGKQITCKCANFVYAGENLVKFYCRYYACNNKESVLVYDIDEFKHGFAGENIEDWIESL